MAGTDDLEGAVVIELVGIDVVGRKLNGASDVGLEVVGAFEGVELVGKKMRVGLDDGSGLGDLLGVAVGVTVGAVLLGAGLTEYFMFPANENSFEYNTGDHSDSPPLANAIILRLSSDTR